MDKDFYKCPGCGNINTHSFESLIDSNASIPKILSPDFFVRKCDLCDKKYIIHHPLLFIDSKKRFAIFLNDPEDSYVDSKMRDLFSDDLFLWRKRIALDVKSFREKIHLNALDFDDRVVEILKYLFELQIKNEHPDKKIYTNQALSKVVNDSLVLSTDFLIKNDNGGFDEKTFESTIPYSKYVNTSNEYKDKIVKSKSDMYIGRKWAKEIVEN